MSEVANVPEEMERVDVAWGRYLVFPFSLESGKLGYFLTTIFTEWFPSHAEGVQLASGDHIQTFESNSGLEALEPGPELAAIPSTLRLDGEIWVPLGS
ncbi:MAG: hypothetical protein CL473_08895 [Acidobacteria bacterium]|mgnify:FL=1|nr:hypothetical protein [Acidobacteriota bacterium]